MIYRFEDFELDSDQHELRRAGEPQKMEPQVFALLSYFVANPERLITKDEIIEKIWDGRFISDAAINSRIRSARNAVSDDGKAQRLIKTVHSRGFRFVGEVVHDEKETPPPKSEQPQPVTLNERTSRAVVLPAENQKTKLVLVCLAALLLLGGFFAFYQWQPGTADRDNAAGAENYTASIAVLPFTDRSPDANQKYLGDGIAEELLNVLARVDGLKVTSRTSAFAFRGKDVRIGEIGQALDVAHVLEGSVRQVGETIRVTAQLIDTKSDSQIWSKTYDRPMTAETFLKVQDEITATIVTELMGKLSLSDNITAPKLASLEAYEFFLRAKELMRESTPESLNTAIGLYERTIALEPDYAPAYANLAQAIYRTEFYAAQPRDLVIAKMKPHVRRGLELAPNDAEVLLSAGLLAEFEENQDLALQYFDRSIASSPKYADAHAERAGILQLQGQFQTALAGYEEALIHDPLSPPILGNIAAQKLAFGDIAGATEAAETNLQWNGDAAQALNMMAEILIQKGDYPQAHTLLLKAAKTNASEGNVQRDLANLYINIGMDKQALDVVRRPGTRARIAALIDPNNENDRLNAPPDNTDFAYAAYVRSDFSAAYPEMKKLITSYELTGDSAIGVDEILWIAEYSYVFQKQGESDAKILIDRIGKLVGKSPSKDVKLIETALGGAALRMLDDDPDGALKWLDHLIDNGHAFLKLTNQPIFAPLKGHPGFAARMKRMEQNAAKHRAVINKQIANN